MHPFGWFCSLWKFLILSCFYWISKGLNEKMIALPKNELICCGLVCGSPEKTNPKIQMLLNKSSFFNCFRRFVLRLWQYENEHYPVAICSEDVNSNILRIVYYRRKEKKAALFRWNILCNFLFCSNNANITWAKRRCKMSAKVTW